MLNSRSNPAFEQLQERRAVCHFQFGPVLRWYLHIFTMYILHCNIVDMVPRGIESLGSIALLSLQKLWKINSCKTPRDSSWELRILALAIGAAAFLAAVWNLTAKFAKVLQSFMSPCVATVMFRGAQWCSSPWQSQQRTKPNRIMANSVQVMGNESVWIGAICAEVWRKCWWCFLSPYHKSIYISYHYIMYIIISIFIYS